MTVHPDALGMVMRLYVPALTRLPATSTSLLKLILVEALAPVRQILPSGTSSPQIFRFFTPGLLYSTLTSAGPSR